MYRCNVLIVGAGLAGLSAAMHMARLGIKDVTVIERMSGERYGRYHRTCGEAVSERSVRLSGMDRSCIVRPIEGIKVSYRDISMYIRSKGYIIDREALLENMRRCSDANIISGSVTAIEATDDGYTVSTTAGDFSCNYLIGADGAFSVVRKSIFGTSPVIKLPVSNRIVEGDSDSSVLDFEICSDVPGTYSWDFPSKDGLRSMGSIIGTGDASESKESGIRFIVSGSDRTVVKGGCCLVGDAAMLINPISYGGIGAALISGCRAAESIAKDDLQSYRRWILKDVMFDRHFMESYDTVSSWTVKDIEDALVPFRKGYSVAKGLYAMMRRPKWASVYTSIWMGFRHGW